MGVPAPGAPVPPTPLQLVSDLDLVLTYHPGLRVVKSYITQN